MLSKINQLHVDITEKHVDVVFKYADSSNDGVLNL